MTTTQNPSKVRYVKCQHCTRFFRADTGYYMPHLLDSDGEWQPILPDDCDGVIEGNGCCRECRVPFVRQGLKPTAWIIGGLVAALVFHVGLLILLNL